MRYFLPTVMFAFKPSLYTTGWVSLLFPSVLCRRSYLKLGPRLTSSIPESVVLRILSLGCHISALPAIHPLLLLSRPSPWTQRHHHGFLITLFLLGAKGKWCSILSSLFTALLGPSSGFSACVIATLKPKPSGASHSNQQCTIRSMAQLV